MTDFNQIGALPAPSIAHSSLPSGTVSLYRHNLWSSPSLELRTNDYREGARHTLTGTDIQDAATWIAFNLPVGTVMTLTEHRVEQDGFPVWNLRKCGRTLDLIGTGSTQAVDLTQCNMNDCISSFFWRRIRLQIGALELFEHSEFRGSRTVLFLDDWMFSTTHSLDGWYIKDRLSSARWHSLDSTVAASFFNNVDGTGSSFHNIMGWSGSRQMASFKSTSFNDVLTAFRWEGLIPMKEVIQPLAVPVTILGENAFTLTSQVSGVNNSAEPLPVTIGLSDATAQTVTVATTEALTKGTTMTATVGYKMGNDVTGETTGELSVAVHNSYTHSTESTNTETRTVTLSITQQPSVPAQSSYRCTMFVEIGQLPLTTYSTQVTRWYDQPVSGGEMDPANNNWYRRTENYSFTVAGGLASKVNVNVVSTPL